MFKIISNGSNGWKSVIGVLSTLQSEATVEIKPEGIQFRAMDSSHIALVDCFWVKDNFKIYDVKEEQKLSFNADDVNAILKRAGDEDIELNYSGGNKIDILIGATKKYDFPLVQMIELPPKPKPQFEETNKVNISELASTIEDIKIINTTFDLSIQNGSIKLYAKADFSNRKGEVVVLDNDIKVKNTLKSTFQTDFLMNPLKVIRTKDGKVGVAMVDGKLLRFTFDVENLGEITYFVSQVQRQ